MPADAIAARFRCPGRNGTGGSGAGRPRSVGAAEARLRLCERQLVELNHRIANTLQIASGLIRAHRGRLADPSAKEVLDAAIGRLEAIARLHWHLCRRGEAQRVDFGRYIAEIAPAIEGAAGLTCELDLEPCEVPGEAALHLAIALIELVLNARKHAYHGQDGGQVRLGCRRGDDGRLHLSVANRGPGRPDGFDPGRTKGLGMTIVGATMR
ncbi:MAG: sensor histidine kinase [Acidimicrobiales bacterium]